jgi:hypothetical protein
MNLEQALEIIGGFSKAGKMPCRTYSLNAKDCLIGNRVKDIAGSVCGKCYARRGNFMFDRVIKANDRHKAALTHPLWVEAMVTALTLKEKSGFFRWFASGDVQSIDCLRNIFDVAIRTPHIQHWLPTKEIAFLYQVLKTRDVPKNLVIRTAAFFIEQQPHFGLFESSQVRGSAVSKISWNCPSSKQGGKCLSCRMCWDKKVDVVTYKYH